jgi:hypothetical protein
MNILFYLVLFAGWTNWCDDDKIKTMMRGGKLEEYFYSDLMV